MSTDTEDTKDKGIEKDTKGKGIEKDFSKVSSTTKYQKCQGYGHVTANCPSSVKISFVNGVLVAETESDSHEFTYQAEEEDFDFDEEITCDDIGLNCIRSTLLTHLSVIRWASPPPKEKDD